MRRLPEQALPRPLGRQAWSDGVGVSHGDINGDINNNETVIVRFPPKADKYSGNLKGGIVDLSIPENTVTTLMTNSFNNPDRIVRDSDGFYYVGGYYLPGIYKIAPDFSGEPELFFEGTNMVYPTYHEEIIPF